MRDSHPGHRISGGKVSGWRFKSVSLHVDENRLRAVFSSNSTGATIFIFLA